MLPIKKILLVIPIIFLILIFINGWHIELNVNEDEVSYKYGEVINLETPKAYFKGIFYLKEGIELPVTTESNINYYKLGNYTVIYKTSFLFFNETKIKNVNIVDKEPPIIELTHNPDYYTTPGQVYIEEGFYAYDNYDGDITQRVSKNIIDGIVYYSVSDTAGNTAQATREINYKDVTPPEITLFGEDTILLVQDEEYIEPGFNAIDNCDGNITNKVTTTTSLDITTPGIYYIKYAVQDSYDNTDSKIRTIVVNKKEIIEEELQQPEEPLPIIPEKEPENEKEPIINKEIENPEKVIYLTFDDGPSKHTTYLLSILKKYNVKATFFVVGSKYRNVISQIYEDGHSIGAHSYTHEYKDIYSSMDAYFEDLEIIRNIIFEETGYYTNLIRFPGGSSNSVSKNYKKGIMTELSKEVEARGYQYFDWNVSSGDAGQTIDTETVYQNVISGIGNKKTAIVLQHDTKKYSIDAVEKIIQWGIENGYTFLPLDMNSPKSHHGIKN